MNHDEQIMVGGHPLSGILQGADYRITRLSGWWERPQRKNDALAREGGDGDFPTPWQFQPRYITIGGVVHCKDHGQMHHIMDQLNGLCATRREWLSVQGHGPLQSAFVEADDEPVLETVTDTTLRFVLYFKANDPRKYGEQRRVQLGYDSVALQHAGNYPAPVSVDVSPSGADEGFRLAARFPDMAESDPSWIWGWYDMANASQEHRIDLHSGRHFVNGSEVARGVGRSERWDLAPHSQTTVNLRVHEGVGTILGYANYRDTWI